MKISVTLGCNYCGDSTVYIILSPILNRITSGIMCERFFDEKTHVRPLLCGKGKYGDGEHLVLAGKYDVAASDKHHIYFRKSGNILKDIFLKLPIQSPASIL